MALRAPLRFAALFAVLAALALPGAADAAVYQLRPNANFLVPNWTTTPAGTAHWDAVNDAVTRPALPTTATDYASSTSNSGFSVHVDTVTLAPGETVASITAWFYLAAGSNRAPHLFMANGGLSLADTTYPAGSPAGWYSTTYTGTMTQAELDALYIAFTPEGNGGSTATVVYAGYAEVTTIDPPPPPPVDPPPSDPPPSDPPPSDPPPSDPPPADPPPVDPPPSDSPADPVPTDPVPTSTDPTGPVPTSTPTDPAAPTTPELPPVTPVDPIVEPALDIAGTSTTATPKGDVPIKASCANDHAGPCEGALWLEEPLDVSGAQLRAARRTPKRFSKTKRYKLNPGQSKTIPVRLDRRTYRKFKRKRSFKVAVVAQEKGPNGQVVTERRTFRVYNKTKKKRRS